MQLTVQPLPSARQTHVGSAADSDERGLAILPALGDFPRILTLCDGISMAMLGMLAILQDSEGNQVVLSSAR